MTEEINQEPDETVVLAIALTKEGQVRVTGPLLADRTACYGILETAKDLVRELHTPKVMKPTPAIMNFIRNGKH